MFPVHRCQYPLLQVAFSLLLHGQNNNKVIPVDSHIYFSFFLFSLCFLLIFSLRSSSQITASSRESFFHENQTMKAFSLYLLFPSLTDNYKRYEFLKSTTNKCCQRRSTPSTAAHRLRFALSGSCIPYT